MSYGSLGGGPRKNRTRSGSAWREDLDRAWEVLGEAVQTVMRAHGIPDAYDRLKSFTRGRPIDRAAMREFIASAGPAGGGKGAVAVLGTQGLCGLAPALAKRALALGYRVSRPKRDAVGTSLPEPNGTIRSKYARSGRIPITSNEAVRYGG